MMNRTQRTEKAQQAATVNGVAKQIAGQIKGYTHLLETIKKETVSEQQIDKLENSIFAVAKNETFYHDTNAEQYSLLLSLPAVSAVAEIAEETQRRRDAETDTANSARKIVAEIITAAVCKKVDNVSCTEKTRQLRNTQIKDSKRLDNAAAVIAAEITGSTTKDGDYKTEETADLSPVERAALAPVGDGADLRQIAFLYLLEHKNRHADTVYTHRVLDKRVLCRDADSAAWKDAETTEGQQAHRAVRQAIENNRAINDNTRYLYFSEITTDGETAEETVEKVVYRRMPKYFSEIGYAEHSDISADMPLSVSDSIIEKNSAAVVSACETIAEKLRLSAGEKETLFYALRGYGVAATATALGCSDPQVSVQRKRIRAKAEACGLLNAKKQKDAVLFMLSADADEQKTAAQKAAELTDTAQKAAQRAQAAQGNAKRARIAARLAALKGENVQAAEKAAQAAQKAAEKAAQAAQKAAEKAAQAAQAAQKAARLTK